MTLWVVALGKFQFPWIFIQEVHSFKRIQRILLMWFTRTKGLWAALNLYRSSDQRGPVMLRDGALGNLHGNPGISLNQLNMITSITFTAVNYQLVSTCFVIPHVNNRRVES